MASSEKTLIDEDELYEVEGGMMRETEYRGGVRGSVQKQYREEFPSGFLYLTQYEAVRLLVDALMDADPEDEFSKTDLAELSGLSRKAIHQHIDMLVELGLLEPHDGRFTRYSVVHDSPVLEAARQLSDAVFLAATSDDER